MKKLSLHRRAIVRGAALAAVVGLVAGVGIGSFTLGAAQAASSSEGSANGDPLPTKDTKPTATAVPPATTAARFTMLCRGPFLFHTGASARIEARKSDRLPGNFGDELAPGRCSINNRLLTGTEQADIFFDYTGNVNATNLAHGVATALSACALDENCIISAQVATRTPNSFKTIINETPLMWKRGRHPAINH